MNTLTVTVQYTICSGNYIQVKIIPEEKTVIEF